MSEPEISWSHNQTIWSSATLIKQLYRNKKEFIRIINLIEWALENQHKASSKTQPLQLVQIQIQPTSFKQKIWAIPSLPWIYTNIWKFSVRSGRRNN